MIAIGSGAVEWLQPFKFFFTSGERLVVSFKGGENFMGQPLDLKKNQVGKLEFHQLTKSTDVLDSLMEGQNNLRFTLNENGTSLLMMQTNNERVERDGEQFNVYLKDEGLDEVLEHRQKTNTLASPGKEFNSQCAKLLVQVGEKRDDTFKKIVGLPIEIIPLQNPYTLKKGDPIRFKILFEGTPLFGVKVKVWNRFDNRTTLQNIHTGKDGVIETHISNPGSWLVSVVKMVPSKQGGTEWQSYRGSLTFGIQ